MNRTLAAPAFTLLAICSAPALAQHEHKILDVARDDAGMLHMHTHAVMPFEMEHSIFDGIDGFATAEVAFESLDADHPQVGLHLLDEAADIRAILIAADPGIQVFAGIDPLPIGGELVLGHPFFHYLPVYNIFNGQLGHEYAMRFKFHDASGIYADSDEFNIRFIAVPAPAAAFPLLGLVTLRRIRR